MPIACGPAETDATPDRVACLGAAFDPQPVLGRLVVRQDGERGEAGVEVAEAAGVDAVLDHAGHRVDEHAPARAQ